MNARSNQERIPLVRVQDDNVLVLWCLQRPHAYPGLLKILQVPLMVSSFFITYGCFVSVDYVFFL